MKHAWVEEMLLQEKIFKYRSRQKTYKKPFKTLLVSSEMYIKVKVFPRSKKNEFVKVGNNRFEIKVKEKAERNMANKKIIQLLAEYFEVKENQVKIINGHHSPSKLISINSRPL